MEIEKGKSHAFNRFDQSHFDNINMMNKLKSKHRYFNFDKDKLTFQ